MFMVAIFFVLSGFVLSYSLLKKMHDTLANRDGEILISLSSSLLRRPFRLFVPMLTAMSITSVLTWFFPTFEQGHWRDGDPNFIAHWWQMMEIASPTLNAYNWGYYWPRGFTHGWTLALEYRGSIVIYLICLLTCKFTPNLRKAMLGFSAWYALAEKRWEIFCFIEGMILAELRISPISLVDLYSPTIPKMLQSMTPGWLDILTPIDSLGKILNRMNLRPVAWSVVLTFGLLVGGWPTYGAVNANPWKALYAVTPAAWTSHGEAEPDPTQMWWISAGAGLVVLSLEALPGVRKIFTTTIMTYLGEISYAFYLLHQPVMFSFGAWTLSTMKGAGYSNVSSFIVEYIVTLFLILCAADLFWRGIDEKVVKACRVLSTWCGL
jgi:peptidoglycan/LPS O-acetylase OafA/YrhL